MDIKRLLMMLVLAVSCLSALAEDVIVKKDGSTILAWVEEATDTDVKYRKAKNANGPLYTIKIADLMRINYDNGEVDIFSEDGMTPRTVLHGAIGSVADTDLLKMYERKGSGSINPGLPKKLRLIGFVGGGALIVGGAIMAAIGGSNYSIDGYDGAALPLFIGGSVLCAGGIAGMTSLCIIANRKQKQINEWNAMSYAPIYRQQLFLKEGKSLSMGVDYIGDRFTTHSLGVGMTFNF